ncbi:MAG: hypothetical protein ACYCV7_17470, partial [Acidimicrobiales bacterium]
RGWIRTQSRRSTPSSNYEVETRLGLQPARRRLLSGCFKCQEPGGYPTGDGPLADTDTDTDTDTDADADADADTVDRTRARAVAPVALGEYRSLSGWPGCPL